MIPQFFADPHLQFLQIINASLCIILIMHTYIPQRVNPAVARSVKYVKLSELPKPTDFLNIMQTMKDHKLLKTNFSEQGIMELRKWSNLIVPTLLDNMNQLVKQSKLELMYNFFAYIKFHRQSIVEATYKIATPQYIKNMKNWTLLKTYKYLVFFKQTQNSMFLDQIRQQLISRTKTIDLKITNITNMRFFLYVTQCIILDLDLTRKQKQEFLNKIKKSKSQYEVQNFKKGSAIDNFAHYYKNIFQGLKLYDIEIDARFMKIYEDVHTNFQQIVKSDARFEFSEFESNNQRHTSVFQRIFQNKLTQYGFEFDSNILLKGNQYDIIVKAKRYEKLFPFSNIDLRLDDLSTLPSLSLQQVKTLAESGRIQNIEQYKKLKDQVVIYVNGPMHYIDSDALPEYSIGRLEQFNSDKLSLYGFKKYNIVNYEQWEIANRYSRISERFVNDKIMNPRTIQVQKK